MSTIDWKKGCVYKKKQSCTGKDKLVKTTVYKGFVKNRLVCTKQYKTIKIFTIKF